MVRSVAVLVGKVANSTAAAGANALTFNSIIMKTVINPEYNYLTDFINSLPHTEPVPDEVFQNNRNYVYKLTVEGAPLVVKKYKRPVLANCVIYTWFRMNKAERSYKYAFRLKEMGFDTAEPVAYIVKKKYGFVHTCYYITRFLPYPLLSSCTGYDRQTILNIVNDFAEYTCNLHKSGISHYDYNLGNVLFHKEGGKYKFTVIDINRIVFSNKINSKRIKGLRGMGFPLPLFSIFIERYTQLAGFNTEIFFGALLLNRGMNLTKRMKNKLKAFIAWIKSAFAKNGDVQCFVNR